jgi:hypothetical protein
MASVVGGSRSRLSRPSGVDDREVVAASRHLLENWLSTDTSGDREPDARREGRGRRALTIIVEPLRDSMSTERPARLEAARCLVAGREAVIVLRDVLGREPDENVDVARWATEAVLAAVDQQPTETARRSTVKLTSRP